MVIRPAIIHYLYRSKLQKRCWQGFYFASLTGASPERHNMLKIATLNTFVVICGDNGLKEIHVKCRSESLIDRGIINPIIIRKCREINRVE